MQGNTSMKPRIHDSRRVNALVMPENTNQKTEVNDEDNPSHVDGSR